MSSSSISDEPRVHISCARLLCTVSRDHNVDRSSPKGEGFRPSASETLSSLLLFPTRESTIIIELSVTLFIVTWVVQFGLHRKRDFLKTQESSFAQLMLWTPLFLLLGRNVYYKPLSDTFIATCIGLPSSAIYGHSIWVAQSWVTRAIRRFCILGIVIAAWYLGHTTFPFSLLLGGVLFFLSIWMDNGESFLFRTVGILSLYACALTDLFSPNWGTIITSLILFTAYAALAIRSRQTWIFSSAVFGFAVTLIGHLILWVRFPAQHLWMIYCGFGLFALWASSRVDVWTRTWLSWHRRYFTE